MISEQDIQLLEMHLDGQLTDAENALLTKRLEGDAQLAAELARLTNDRRVRAELWAPLEGDENAGEAVLSAVTARVSRRNWFYRILDHREKIAAAAACVAVFLMGWQWGRNVNAYRMHPGSGAAGTPVRLITQQQVPTGTANVFEVRVTDESGNLLRLERFRTLQEAQAYIEKTKREFGQSRD